MEKVLSYYEKNGGTYHHEGDYLIPNLFYRPKQTVTPSDYGAEGTEIILSKTKSCVLTYAKKEHASFIINEQAKDMFLQLVKELAEEEGITKTLKAENQMEWVRRMNNIRNRATEIVNNELIYI